MAGHIKQVSRGRWRIVIEAGKDPATGRRKRVVRYFRGRENEAKDYMAKLIVDINGGSYLKPAKISVAEWLHEWAKGKKDLSPVTQIAYCGYIKNHLAPYFGKLTLEQLQPLHIEKFKQEKLSAGLSATSVSRYMAVLHSALEHAVSMRILRENPASHVRHPRATKKEPRALSLNELRRFLDSIEKSWLKNICMFAAFTGLRRGEIIGLKWSNVDLDNALVYVRVSKQRIAGKWIEKSPKSESGIRSVPLTVELVNMLKKIKTDHELVFCQADGKPIWPSLLGDCFRKAANAAGFADLTFHGLRHTFAKHILDFVPVNTAQRLLGHGRASTTVDMYGHNLPGQKEEAIAKLENAWRHQTGTKKTGKDKK